MNHVFLLGALLTVALLALPGAAADAPQRVPVILDTDIGDDIDDTWALLMLLKSTQLDLKLVTTTFGKAEYRGKIIAKLLTLAKRTDVQVGLGAGGRNGVGGQQDWVKDYDLKSYPGKIHEDGVQALVDAVTSAPQPLTIISIGPSNTVAAALEKQPDIAPKAVFVGMQGAVRKGYNGAPTPCPEWNVKANIPASQKVLLAPWRQCRITPLDTCGLANLSGPRFKTLRESDDELVKALLENYRVWAKKKELSELTASSILFDTVAVYLAYPEAKPLLEMEELNITVTKTGMTALDAGGVKMSVATAWKDLNGFRDLLVKVLLQPVAPRN